MKKLGEKILNKTEQNENAIKLTDISKTDS